MKVVAAVDRWIFRTYEPCVKSLPYYRILFSVYLLAFYLPKYAWLARMPDSLFHPPLSLALLFPGLPPGWFFYSLDFLLEFGALCLLAGRQTRLVSFAMAAGLIIGNSFRYSIGPKIDHDILVPTALFCLGFSGWGNRFSQDEALLPGSARRSSSSWPIALLMLALALAMFTAVYPKAMTGWLNPQVYACRGQIIANILLYNRPSRLADFLLQIQSPLFWKLGDWSTLALEGGFLFAIFFLPALRFIVTLATFFHVLIYFSMDIFFSSSLLIYACLLDLRVLLGKSWMRRLARRLHFLLHRIRLFHLGLLATAFLVFYYRAPYDSEIFIHFANNLTVFIALVIALGSLFHFLGAWTARFVRGRDLSSNDHPFSRDA